VELNARTYLFYDDNVVEGYMLQAQTVKTSDTPLMVQLNFRLFLTSYSNVTMIDVSDMYPIRQGVELPNLKLAALPGQGNDPTSLTDSLRNIAGGASSVRDQLGVMGGIASAAGISPLADALNTSSGVIGSFSDYVSQVANTAGQLADVVDSVDNMFGTGKKNPLSRMPNVSRSAPLRSFIANNLDEYPGPYPFSPDVPSDGKKGGGLLADAESLAMKTITAAKSVGALVTNTPNLLAKLGVISPPGNPPGQGTVSTTAQVAAANAAAAGTSQVPQGGAGSSTAIVSVLNNATKGISFVPKGGLVSTTQPVAASNAADAAKLRKLEVNKVAFGMASSPGTFKQP
jgi:hypothetical protein